MFPMNNALWNVVAEIIDNKGTTAGIMQDRPDITHQSTGGDRRTPLSPCKSYAADKICGYYGN